MSSSPQNIEAAVLWWCRQFSDQKHHYVMRNLSTGRCGVLDMFATEPKPGGYEWETRTKVVAEGDSWEEVAKQLTAANTQAARDSLAAALPKKED